MAKLKVVAVSLVVLFAVAGIVFQPAPTMAGKSKILRMAYPSADRGFAPEMIKWWGSRVEELTRGTVKIQYYWGGILGTSKEMLYSIEKGMCDVGVIFPMYFSTELPLATVNTCMISTGKNDPALTSRSWATLAAEFPQIPAEWEAHNQKLLMGWEVGPYMWVSKELINSFADLKGMKVGIWGGKGPRQLAVEMGSIPRSIASVEVYDALDKSTIDARAESLPMVITYKHYEICKNVTDVGVGTIGAPVYAMSINMKVWNSLSEEVQEQILQATQDWWGNYEKRITEAQVKDRGLLEEKGMKFNEFSQADREKIQSLPVYKSFRQQYIDRAKDGKLAAMIFDRYRQLLNQQ